jgi:glycosyltransferase involved in cell wall biosynthesis
MAGFVLKNSKEIDCVVSVLNNTMFVPFLYKCIRPDGIAVIKMDSDWRLYERGHLRWLKRILGHSVLRVLSRRIDLFIVETPDAMARLLKLHSFLAKKLVLLPNGVDYERIRQAEERCVKPKMLGSKPNSVVLLVGDVIPARGVDLLLAAFSTLSSGYSDWKLRIVGPANDAKYLRFLKDLVKRNALEERVVFVGGKTFDQVVCEFKDADIFCCPTRWGSFGLVVIEAMALGVPVVASNVGVAPWALSDNCGLVYEADSVVGLAAHLSTLMRNGALREEIRGRARYKCATVFNYARIAHQLSRLLEERAKSSSRRRM